MSLNGMRKQAAAAKAASYEISALSSAKRNSVLRDMAVQLVADMNTIITENAKDLANAGRYKLSGAMTGRLKLDEKKVRGMAKGLREIAALPDPLNRNLETVLRPNGLKIRKISVPLGVVLIIFESRPNVTADCAGLCFKSGNSVILRGGKEAHFSNIAIHKSLQKTLIKHGVDTGCVQLVTTRSREDVGHLLQLTEEIDVVIPRGGEGLIRAVAGQSKIPVIKHYKGVCHTYIDKDADIAKAVQISRNAKVQNPGVCNAMETLLVHKSVAAKFLPAFEKAVADDGLQLRACPLSRKYLKKSRPAGAKDWGAEYLDLILAVRIVSDVDEAVAHVRKYGSGHSDAVVSRNRSVRAKFISGVPSACVFENASTRFADGGEFGMGAEMGISTDKLHARGPVGLKELTSYQYIVTGTGQIRK